MLTGYYTPSDSHNNPQKQTILFFYGNGSCANDCWDIVREFQSMGCSVMLVDYPGFGMSKGKASDTGCYDAAEAAYKYLTHTRGISDEKIIIAGWSLGSSVAIHLASQHVCAGLMTFSAFTNMTEMASHEYPVVPEWISSILLKYRFPSIEMISHVRCPTLIAHGSLDRYVPTYMADKLAAADHGQVTRVTVAGAGHNDILSNKNAKLYREIAVWLGRIPDTAAAH
jgi:pimeloyl-ACP methyl ester carboxylesterase